MQSDRDLLKQALHTLEGWANHGEWVWPESALEQAKRNTTEAITALRERLAQPEPTADEVIASHAKRLALELEGVLLECEDTSATSKWWGSAYQAIHNFHDDVDRLYPQDHVSPLGRD